MAELKTKSTDIDPRTYLETVEPARRREDGLVLLELFERVTGLPARMWGPSMIGFGRYAYTYDSGHSGEMFLTGFAPRKANLVVYILPGYADYSAELARLGKHRKGKSCLYINKLADVDMDVLEELIRAGIADMKGRYEILEG